MSGGWASISFASFRVDWGLPACGVEARKLSHKTANPGSKRVETISPNPTAATPKNEFFTTGNSGVGQKRVEAAGSGRKRLEEVRDG